MFESSVDSYEMLYKVVTFIEEARFFKNFKGYRKVYVRSVFVNYKENLSFRGVNKVFCNQALVGVCVLYFLR